jgi:hypothetical protein
VTSFADAKLGVDDRETDLATSEDHRAAALAMAQQACRYVDVFTRDLEPTVYNNADFVEAVARLARRSPHTYIRVLIQDSQMVVKSGHRLVELSRRLSSHFEVRKPHEDYKDYNEAFLVADGRGVIHKRFADRHEGTANFNAPRRARDLTAFFDEVWERSEPDPELRRLYI